MRITRSNQPVFLLALAVLTFVPFVGQGDIVTSHEARVVQVARQMAESGWPWNSERISVPRVELAKTPQGERLRPLPDGSTMQVNPWIVPVMNGQIRLQKPPLPYWCTAVLYRLLGFSELASRIIPALMGCFSTLLVWDLCRRLSNRMTAFYAAIAWISTYFIVDEFRKAMADPYLAFFTLVAMWAWVRGKTRGWRTLFYIALGLGILSKGPLIFVFVIPTIVAYAWCFHSPSPGTPGEGWGEGPSSMAENESSPTPLPAYRERVWHHLPGLVLLILMLLPWPIAVLRAVPNALELWRYESIGALGGDKIEDRAPWWYYLPNLLLITLPWTPLWAVGLWNGLKRQRGRRMIGGICTIIVVLIFSCAYAKKNAYLLPLAPLQCLLAGQGLEWLSAILRRRPARVSIARVAVLAVVFSVLIQVVLAVQIWRDNSRSPRDAGMFVARLLAESPRRSILLDRMPEDATPYLPLGLRESTDSDEVYVILDNRKGGAQDTVETIAETPAGAVTSREELSVPGSKVMRWKVYRLTISPVQRAAPGPG